MWDTPEQVWTARDGWIELFELTLWIYLWTEYRKERELRPNHMIQPTRWFLHHLTLSGPGRGEGALRPGSTISYLPFWNLLVYDAQTLCIFSFHLLKIF